jgi:FlaA1/EpsC-like NDP-sugar epimerase
LLYIIFDNYGDLYRLSRLDVFIKTFWQSAIGVVIVFSLLYINRFASGYIDYLNFFFLYFALHFTLTVIARMILLTWASRRLKAGKVSYNTIIVGGNENARQLYKELTGSKQKSGHDFKGFVYANGEGTEQLGRQLESLGDYNQLPEIIEQYHIEEALIAIETSDHGKLKKILDLLFDYDDLVLVKVIPDM